MHEGIPVTPSPEREPSRKEKLISLAAELFESGEVFPFPGIDPEAYPKMKVSEEEYPGEVTPIDEIIARLKNEGMKVVTGAEPQSGNVYILPATSTDIKMDGISPKQLRLSPEMNEKLKALISLIEALVF